MSSPTLITAMKLEYSLPDVSRQDLTAARQEAMRQLARHIDAHLFFDAMRGLKRGEHIQAARMARPDLPPPVVFMPPVYPAGKMTFGFDLESHEGDRTVKP